MLYPYTLCVDQICFYFIEVLIISDDNSDNLSDKGGDAKKGKRKMEDETENKNPSPPKKKKGTNKGKENITENEKLSSVPPADSSKIGSKTTHIGLDTLALKKLKNQEKRKEITENPSEIGNSSSKKKKGNQAKKMKKLEAMQKGDNSVKSIETVSQGDNSGKTSQSPAKQSKNKQKQLNNSSLEIVDNDVRLSEQVIEVKNKRKRKSSQNLDVSVQEHNSVPTPSKEKTPKVKKNKVTKLNNSITEATMESERSGFAKFDKLLKTPPAFVRKSVSKFTTPKSAVKQVRTICYLIYGEKGMCVRGFIFNNGNQKLHNIQFEPSYEVNITY